MDKADDERPSQGEGLAHRRKSLISAFGTERTWHGMICISAYRSKADMVALIGQFRLLTQSRHPGGAATISIRGLSGKRRARFAAIKHCDLAAGRGMGCIQRLKFLWCQRQ
jgi:hypothetical protein